MVYSEYTWIFACSVIFSFFVAYGIGANDVANAFGSSVGAKAITMKQAILIAAVCEFTGSVLMGAGVTSTIRKGIADIEVFVDTPDILMYGMLCALLASGIWLLIATYWELPVSTTHSIVGAIIGMTLVAAGGDGVKWASHKDTFPFVDGVAGICLSWIFSPILAGICAALIFFLVRAFVLRSKDSLRRSYWTLPFFVFVTFFVITIFIIKQGGAAFDWDDTPYGKACWIGVIVGAGASLISAVVFVPLIRKRVNLDIEAEKAAAEAAVAAAAEGGVHASDDKAQGKNQGEGSSSDGEHAVQQPAPEVVDVTTPHMLRSVRKSRVWSAMTKSANFDIHETLETDQKIADIHGNCEVFDHRAELSFKYLQVFTAMANSFAHGSNDVANAIGPFAAIYFIWKNDGQVDSKADVPTWILAVGGVGIVVGLATYGYKIMRVLGVKMTKLTNSRGFVVELSAAIVVVVGSRYGLPLSTTQCMVGAVTGIGLLEGAGGFNWMLLLKFFGGWVATLVVAGLTAAFFTAQGIYAPNKTMSNERVDAGWYLNGTSTQIAALLNSTGNAKAQEQAQSILTAAGYTQNPILSLTGDNGPIATQSLALSLIGNDTASLCAW